uniref:Uncharacterized protein n=1 Tax=viral metagenome TaxID=1070528 RepID=A0A6M3LBC9_9ZZZZ
MKFLYKLLGLAEDDPLNELDKLEKLEQECELNNGLNDGLNNGLNIGLNSKQNGVPENVCANITFSILTTGDLHVNCQWLDIDIAKAYGEMLYKITGGSLIAEIISILVEYARQSPKDANKINNILNCWRRLKEQEENQPLIKPSDVLSLAQFKQNLQNQEGEFEED